MATFKSRWGYHPVDYPTYVKIKRLNYLLLLALKRRAALDRWIRKAPQNRVWRRRPHRAAKPEVLGPRLAPVESPLTLIDGGKKLAEKLHQHYASARYPAPTPEAVVPISDVWLSLMEVWLLEGEKWLRDHGRENAPVPQDKS